MNSKDRICSNFKGAEIPMQQPHEEQKKQIRRRRQSRRPYKERPLNMAEARREIVTALKLHRASTKEARERQLRQEQQMKQPLPLDPQLCPCFQPEGRMKSRKNSRIYPGCSYSCSFYMENQSDFSPVAPPKATSLSSGPITSTFSQNLNIEVPMRTVGLNLNFLDSKTVDTAVVCNGSHSFYSLSFLPPASYICPTVSYAATHQEVPKSITIPEEGKFTASDVFGSDVPTAGESEKNMQGTVDEEAMAAIRSIREQQIHEGPDMKAVENDDHLTFDKVMEFPDWLSLNDDFLQQHPNYHCAEDYSQDPELSCMDIGEIEDVAGDWLA